MAPPVRMIAASEGWSSTRRSLGWRTWAATVTLALATWLLAACMEVSPTPEPMTIILASAGASLPLAEDLANAYEAQFPQVDVIVQVTGNSRAAEAWVRSGRADLAMLTHPPQLGAQSPLTTTQIAWEALAVIVNPTNSLDDLSLDQLQRLFSGRLQDWSELGQASGLVQPMIREEGSGSRRALDRAIANGQATAPGALVQSSATQMAAAVAAGETAVGYLPVALVDDRVRPLTINGIPADAKMGVASGYPVLLPIYLATGPDGHFADGLRQFALSEDGQAVIGLRYGRVR